MLNNSSTTITRGADSISVVGVDDAYSWRADLDAAFAGVDLNDFILFLTHSPSAAPDAIRRGADLILSGHTHGGQVRIPGIGMLWTHMRTSKGLNDGLYAPDALKRITGIDPGGSVLFVNRGIGTSRFHIRFLCRPEIAYITLHRA
jgi:predicted MPP superfamily phosphohydrolase